MERRLHATRCAAIDREDHERGDQQDPDDPHGDTHRQRRENGDDRVEERNRGPGHATSLLVQHDRDEPAIQECDRGERKAAEHEHDPEVATRDGQDRAEEELEEADVEPVRARDQHDAKGDAGVEDERERLIAARPAPRAQPLDRECADDGEAERCQHGRDAEQVAGGDPGERDVAEAVADERLAPFDEEEPDRGGEDADDDADGEGEAHELELEHQCA